MYDLAGRVQCAGGELPDPSVTARRRCVRNRPPDASPSTPNPCGQPVADLDHVAERIFVTAARCDDDGSGGGG